jgi:hypothetical protein
VRASFVRCGLNSICILSHVKSSHSPRQHPGVLLPAHGFEPCADFGQVGGANEKKERQLDSQKLPGAMRIQSAKINKALERVWMARYVLGQFFDAQDGRLVSHGLEGFGWLRSFSRAAKAGLSARSIPLANFQRCRVERATPTAAAVLRIECGSAFRPIKKGGLSIVTV